MAREARDNPPVFSREAKGDGMSVLEFSLDDLRYALPLPAVERVVRAVRTTPLPKAPRIVLGVINVKGNVIPVIDLRSRFRLPAREMSCDDRLILARTPRRALAFAADGVSGVRTIAGGAIAKAEDALPFAEYLNGVAALDDGLVMISDLDRFLSLDEEEKLDAALSGDAK
jgi:purine-binding chemotaxis protein CheW